jgi:hypothetical protein
MTSTRLKGPRRLPVALLLCVAVTLGVAGCVNVPTGGTVASGRPAERAVAVDDPYVRLIAYPPGRDWLPAKIVQGFLTSSAASDDGQAVARQYLAPGVDWEPGPRPRVTVYEGSLGIGPAIPADASRMQVTGMRLGKIDPDGQYQALGGRVDQTFQLAKNAQGQWRITALPDALRNGLLLGQRDVDRAFRTLNLYFFAPDRTVLVPNPIFLPLVNRRELPSQLVRAVLTGPTFWLDGAVRSEFPSGTRLLRDRVDVTEGLATVNLSKQAAKGSLPGMSAQLMWTLRQLPEVSRMRLQIDGETVSPPGVSAAQTSQDWLANDSDTTRENSVQQVYLRDGSGRFQQLSGDNALPVDAAGNARVYHPSISLDERQVAGLNESGDTLLLGNIGGAAPSAVAHVRDPKGRFATPTWDRNGTLWTVENYGSGSRLWLMEPRKAPVRVDDWDLHENRIGALRVARDGVRVAAAVEYQGRTQIRIGRIQRYPGGMPQASLFLPISSEVVDVTDLAWRNADELAVLGRTQQQPQPLALQVPVSGGSIQTIGIGGGDMTSIAAAPHSPVLVSAKVTEKGKDIEKICRQSDVRDLISEWQCFVGGHDPAYPG